MTAPRKSDSKALGTRLAQFREMVSRSQYAFAEEIGITRDRLASYETGRAALPWEVYSRIARRFLLNPIWLATGSEHPLSPFLLDIPDAPIAPRMTFLTAFESYERLRTLPEEMVASASPEEVQGSLLAAASVLRRLVGGLHGQRAIMMREKWFQDLGAEVRLLLGALGVAADSPTLSGERTSKPSVSVLIGKGGKKSLHNSHGRVEQGMPKRDLKRMLSQVREMTNVRGYRKLFATAVGVEPNRLSDWLAGTREPSAQQTLTILDLVENGWSPKK